MGQGFREEMKQQSGHRLTTATKLAYGAGEFGPALAANLMIFYLLFFLTSVAGIPPALAAFIPMVGKLWDAINDPLIGWLSDRTKSRYGRRIPWMVIGVVPCAIVFFLHWLVPARVEDGGMWFLFWYYVAASFVYNAVSSAITVPHTALMPEMTQDYDERTSLVSYRSAFSILGSIGLNVLALVVFETVRGELNQYATMGAACALILLASVTWCVFGIWPTVRRREAILAARTSGAPPVRGMAQLKIVFTNKPFLFVCGIYLCSWLAVQVTATILIYYVVNVMKMPEASFSVVALLVMGTAFVVLPLWVFLSHRLGKKAVYYYGMVLWIAAQGGLMLLQPGQVGFMYGLAALAGFGVSVAYLIPWSMVPDVIEYDEWITGQRREGVYYGFMVLLQKLGLALAVFLVGHALAAAGFVQRGAGQAIPEQPESALTAIRMVIGPLPAIGLILGLVCVYFYPITKEKHAAIVRALEERAKAAGRG